jgi:nucleotide sugar dehydrogenase
MKVKACVIGLGEVGLPTAKFFSERGIETWGYDVSRQAVGRATKFIEADTIWHNIPHDEISLYVICVSTGVNGSTPDMSNVFGAGMKIALTNSDKPFISVESTVTPGTCRKLAAMFKSVNLIHVPHRYWRENPIDYGVKQLRVIGGIDEESLRKGIDFYERLGIPLHPVSSIELAELSKIVENSYRFVQIAFAEELKRICDERGLNFDELREACNTKWNVDILEAREGIGGHCLPKDIRYLLDFAESSLLRAAIDADRRYKKWRK